jgi:FkbM family methyltransferase
MLRKNAKSGSPHGLHATRLRRGFASLLRPLPVPWRAKRRLRFAGRLRVEIDDSHAFQIDAPGGPIETDLYFRGFGKGWEAYSLRVWSALVPNARVIVDAGASFGVYSLAAASLNREATVIAFEPLERSYQRLVANIALNGFSVRAEPLALSDSDGEAVLHDRADQAKDRWATLVTPPDGVAVIDQPVKVVRLDGYCEDHGIASIDLLKMDVEGSEPAALRGMASLIAARKPAMVIEVLTDDEGDKIWSQLGDRGYSVYRINENRGLIPASALRTKSGRSRNYLLCSPEEFHAAALDRFMAN